MNRMWMVRAGRDRSKAQTFYSKGVVSIGYKLKNATHLAPESGPWNPDRSALAKHVSDSYVEHYADSAEVPGKGFTRDPDTGEIKPKQGRLNNICPWIARFLWQIRKGDQVVTYDEPQFYYVGTIAGDCTYDVISVPDHTHVRPVAWRGTVDVGLLHERITRSDRRSTVFPIPEQLAEIISGRLSSPADFDARSTDAPERTTPDYSGDENATALLSPPVEGAEALMKLINSLAESENRSERNHSDAVKDLLMGLGHDRENISFETGWIDVCVRNARRETVAVVEVKTSIASARRSQALRQANDYACRCGARIFVITDADHYEIYDRRAGADYDTMFRGKFRLTRFQPADAEVLDLLRPASLLQTPE